MAKQKKTDNQRKAERWVQKHFGDTFVYSAAQKELFKQCYYAGLVDKQTEMLTNGCAV